MRSSRFLLPALLLISACATTPVRETSEVDLRDLQGAPASLNLERHLATVVVFWSTGCPCVARYRERIEALDLTWRDSGVQVIAVSSNVDDDLATLRQAPAPVPLLVDEGGRLAQRLGARSTPTVVVLDREGEVRFRGWIDNERAPGEPGREAWLDEALADLVAGEQVRRPATPVWGCTITRALGERRRCHPVQ